MWPRPYKQTFVPPSHGGSTFNLVSIGCAVSEEMSFENVDDLDNVWQQTIFHPISSHGAFGSGEVKINYKSKMLSTLSCTENIFDSRCSIQYKGSYIDVHFVWNLWNKPLELHKFHEITTKVSFCLSYDFKLYYIPVKIPLSTSNIPTQKYNFLYHASSFFSSPEHEVLMVNYCAQCPSCVVRHP